MVAIPDDHPYRIQMQSEQKLASEISDLVRDDKEEQAYTMLMQHIPIADIALAIGESNRTTRTLVGGYAKKLAEVDTFDREVKRIIIKDKLDTIIKMCVDTIEDTASNSLNKTGLFNALIRAIELQAKIDGLLITRVTGEDGGPIQIQAVSDRQAVIEELKQRLQQSLMVNGQIIDQ